MQLDEKTDTSCTHDDSKPKDEQIMNFYNKPQKTRRPRRQPLMALGDRRIGTDFSDKETAKDLLQSATLSKPAKARLYSKLLKGLTDFLSQASVDWKPQEDCRRFSVFGDCITCARWEGKSIISGVDIIKTILSLYRLNNMGSYPPDRRKFEEGITSDLRSLKLGADAFLESANSLLLKFLYRINSVRTHKRQKVFCWDLVPFHRLYMESLARERRFSSANPFGTMSLASRSLNNRIQKMTKDSSHASSSSDQGSPNSWPSPPNNNTGDGFVMFMSTSSPRGGYKNGIANSEIMKLAIVADAALSGVEGRDVLKLAPLLPSNCKEQTMLPSLHSHFDNEL